MQITFIAMIKQQCSSLLRANYISQLTKIINIVFFYFMLTIHIKTSSAS